MHAKGQNYGNFCMADDFCQIYDRFIKVNGLAPRCGYAETSASISTGSSRGLPGADKILLRKRALTETINDELKNMAQIEHSRHRSVSGFMANLMAGLEAYSFFPKKPMIDVERVSPYENNFIQLELF